MVRLVRFTSPELQPMAVQYTGHVKQMVFRLAAYLLNMICLNHTFIQNCINMNFRIILTQFYINFSRQDHQIDVLHVSFNA